MKRKAKRGRPSKVVGQHNDRVNGETFSTPFSFIVETGIPVSMRGFSPIGKFPDLYNAMKGLNEGDCITYNTSDLAGPVSSLRKILEKDGFLFVTSKVDATTSRTWRVSTDPTGPFPRKTGNGVKGVNTFKKKK